MVVNFMVNSSPKIQVNKAVSSTQPIDCALKENCNILTPTLIVVGVNISAYNYFQIADFGGRYYYIDKVETRNQNTTEVTGEIDPLMSFKADILASRAVIERNEKLFTKYISDSKYTVLNYERIQTKAFPNSFPTNGEFILVVAGS